METDWPPDKNPQHPPSIHAKEDHGLTLRLDRMEAADAEPVHFTLGFQPGRKMPTILWVIRRSRTISGETSIMSRTLMLLASAATLAVTLATPASAQLLQRKDLSLSIALAIANGALEACKAMGYAASVVVVDRAGETLVSLRGDGSGPHTVENARRKAYTANTFKMSTEAFIQDMKTRPVRREQTTLPHVIAINGGVPIKVGNDVIGGVGLSGSPRQGRRVRQRWARKGEAAIAVDRPFAPGAAKLLAGTDEWLNEAPRVHHAARRCSGRVASRSCLCAAGDADCWVS